MILATKNACLFLFAFALMSNVAPSYADMIEADKSSAVIFAYQRIGDDSVPQGSLSLDQFKAQIQELKSDGYDVVPLANVIDGLKSGKVMPPKTVVLTFDGAWKSTVKNIVPILTEAQMPFTIFITSDMADQNSPQHANWDDLRTLKKNKLVSFGMFPSAYVHLTNKRGEDIAQFVNKSIGRFREELKMTPAFFAYPYGEYSTGIKDSLSAYPFTAAFGQQSGVAHMKSDFMALPRFTMTDNFGDFDRFLLTANALPLPVEDMTPADTVIQENPPKIGFTVSAALTDLSRLSCFVSGHGKVGLAKPGGNRVELQLAEPLEDRSTRINCTLPESSYIEGHGTSAWRWFGMQLVNPAFIEQTPDDNALADDMSATITAE